LSACANRRGSVCPPVQIDGGLFVRLCKNDGGLFVRDSILVYQNLFCGTLICPLWIWQLGLKLECIC